MGWASSSLSPKSSFPVSPLPHAVLRDLPTSLCFCSSESLCLEQSKKLVLATFLNGGGGGGRGCDFLELPSPTARAPPSLGPGGAWWGLLGPAGDWWGLLGPGTGNGSGRRTGERAESWEGGGEGRESSVPTTAKPLSASFCFLILNILEKFSVLHMDGQSAIKRVCPWAQLLVFSFWGDP